jgi:Flp pilus assembly protein CpaB
VRLWVDRIRHTAQQFTGQGILSMRAKSLLLLIIALGCGTVASVGISQVMMDQKSQTPSEPPTVEILVAVKDVDVNQKLTSDLVKLEKWPQNRVPEGAMYKLEEAQDRYVRQRMYPGEPILAGKLNDSIVGVDTEIPAAISNQELALMSWVLLK